ncbi:hypothetical protein [Brevundimonas sp.]|uniref:hypothetical protein n=1 Tax=Brevundimonas sp. TaxID=1871086 RepID=UPI002D2BD42C|nr:hypothetical protein [Brevundimonas sp.]HYD28897.1 hypothetical protein [Brevundimonas sp.]
MTDLQAPAIVGRIGSMRVRNGRYFDGDESYQRTSNALKNIETDTYQLDEWKANTLAIGLSSRSDLVLGVAAAAQYDPATGKLTSEAKSTLRGLREQAMQAGKSKAGSNAGTAVHTATERLDMGETVEQVGLPYPYDVDLKAYETLKRAMRLSFRPEHIERTVRLKQFGIAGTFDRLGESGLLVELGILAPGELLVVDVKTETDPLLNLIHIAPQLASYAHGDDMFVPEPQPATDADPSGPFRGRYEPLPNVSKVVGLVVHVRAGRAVPYLIDLTSGWAGTVAAYEQRERIKASKIKLGDEGCWAVALPIDLPPVTEFVADSIARGPLGFSAPAGMTHEQYVAQPALPAAPVIEQAVRRPDGMVDWVPAGIPPGEAPLEAMLWEAIMSADSLEELARLYENATATGIEWLGPIAEAGIARAKIVQCVQRDLHVPASGGACACGWRAELVP